MSTELKHQPGAALMELANACVLAPNMIISFAKNVGPPCSQCHRVGQERTGMPGNVVICQREKCQICIYCGRNSVFLPAFCMRLARGRNVESGELLCDGCYEKKNPMHEKLEAFATKADAVKLIENSRSLPSAWRRRLLELQAAAYIGSGRWWRPEWVIKIDFNQWLMTIPLNKALVPSAPILWLIHQKVLPLRFRCIGN